VPPLRLKKGGGSSRPPLVGDGAGLLRQNWSLTANWRLRGFQLGAVPLMNPA
jgi:hypothetical protein